MVEVETNKLVSIQARQGEQALSPLGEILLGTCMQNFKSKNEVYLTLNYHAYKEVM